MKTKRIKVGHQQYKLIRDDSIYIERGLLGLCLKDEAKIVYAGGKPPDVVADTILHETMHAIWHAYVYRQEVEEEEAVTMLTHGLVQVMRDNKKFFEELKGLL